MSKAVHRVVGFISMSLIGIVYSMPAHALDGAWYVGAGAGVSRLAPETDGSQYTLDDEMSAAAGLYLGLDINDWLAAEAAYTRLGEATLSAGESVGYTAISVGAIAYVYGQRDIRTRQQGLSGYLRLGLNSIDNEASIDLNKADNTAIWLGAGLQWPVGRRWGVRGEVTSYDGDAQAAMASVYWRSAPDAGAQPLSTARKPAATPTVAEPAVNTKPAPAPAPVPEPTVSPRQIAASDCVQPAGSEPSDARGCALISGVLPGVDFQPDTATLTPDSLPLLKQLAATLEQNPDLVIEIQLHTQVYAKPGRAMQLSRERVLAVARYLASQSVDVKRLRARAFGSEQPRADNDTPEGRGLNNRVVLRVLP